MISEFILEIISQKVGVREDSGWVVYKTDYIRPSTGEHTYLRVDHKLRTGKPRPNPLDVS